MEYKENLQNTIEPSYCKAIFIFLANFFPKNTVGAPGFMPKQNNNNIAFDVLRNSNKIVQPMNRTSQYMPNVLANISPEFYLRNSDEELNDDIIFLLSEEDSNLATYRSIIEKEKSRVNKDYDYIIKDIKNMLENSKLQVLESIDEHYKLYVEKYANFKNEILLFKNIKQEILTQTLPHSIPNIDFSKVSNANLLRELEDIMQNKHLSKIYQIISTKQRESNMRIKDISKEIIQQFTSLHNYYNSEALLKFLKEIKENFNQKIKIQFQNMKEFVKPTNLYDNFEEYKVEEQSNGLDHFETFENKTPSLQETFPMRKSNVEDLKIPLENSQVNVETMKISNDRKKYATPFTLDSNNLNNKPKINILEYNNEKQFEISDSNISQESLRKQLNLEEIMPTFQDKFPNKNKNISFKFKDNFRLCSTMNSFKDFTLNFEKNIKTKHNEMPLCLQVIDEELVATGAKDSTIHIYNIKTNDFIFELKGHKGSICCLALINYNNKKYLASGSDHGDSSVKIWALEKREIVRSLEEHSAAVVSMFQVPGTKILVTGSYDREIIVWDFIEGKTLKILTEHTSSIVTLCLAKEENRFVSASLDGVINVWNIRIVKGEFQGCSLEKSVRNSTFVCCANICEQENIMITGDKAGKIKVWNLQEGTTLQSVNVNCGPIVDMLVLEEKNAVFVVSASAKDKNLVVTNLNEEKSSVVDMSNQIYIEFGCGVNPKIQYLPSEKKLQFVAVKQNEKEKSLAICEIKQL